MGGYIGAKTGTLVASASDIRGDISATDTTPEIVLKNTTETDADGTRSGKITFKGEQSGGEESVLAQIQGSHDGASDDEKGDLIFKTNDGSDGASPTERLRIESDGVIHAKSGNLEINSQSTASSGNIDELSFRKAHTSGVGTGEYDIAELKSFTSNGFAGGLDIFTGKAAGGGNYASSLTARFDEKGNVGIGTSTIPAADSAYVTVGTNDYAISHNGFSNNSFFDGSSYKARRAASGHLMQMGDDFNLYNAASVSAGAAQSLVENFRITQAGALKAMQGSTTPLSGTMHSFTTNTSNTYSLMVRDFNASPASQYLVELTFQGASPDNSQAKFLQCRDSTTARLNINSDGDVQNHDNSYGAISDEKLKEQISDASEQWDDVKALRIRKFKFKTDVATGDSDNHWRLGVVAQEVEASGMNKLIKEEADVEVDEEGIITETGTKTKTVKYSILYMKAVKALQEAMARIETLETKVAALEAE